MKSIPYHDRASLPRKSGIYYIYAGSNPFTRNLLYVGKAINLRRRHTNHEKGSVFEDLGATCLEYQLVPLDRLKHEEAIAIAKHRPPLNKRQERPDVWLLWQDRLVTKFCRMIAAGILITVAWRYLLPMAIDWVMSQ